MWGAPKGGEGLRALALFVLGVRASLKQKAKRAPFFSQVTLRPGFKGLGFNGCRLGCSPFYKQSLMGMIVPLG